MSSTKIIQYVHRPNKTELGQASTHETYLLVEAKTDLSDIFPIGVDTEVKDVKTGKTYNLKSSGGNGSEFRINQMGPLYRDYSVMAGDEITITHFETDGKRKNVFSIKTFNRVVITIDGKGRAEIINENRLDGYKKGNGKYSLTVNYQGKTAVLDMTFSVSEKKRSDSPIATDYYSIKINSAPLPKNTYYLNIGANNELVSGLNKSEYNEVVIEDIDDADSNCFKPLINQPLQQIFYGAPGTGKSHRIKEIIQEHGINEKEQVIRTTFHPDSDYCTFVGCYKPIMKSVPQTYVVEGKEKPVIDIATSQQSQKDEIVYDYTPQAFVQAYTKAWTTPGNPIILVIEEINRGNCAQIFGDIFQLLDRGDDGVSDYEIKPDIALEVYLKGYFAGKDDVPEDIRNGEIMKLPANLFIWATMNTSDQSLFPIDSAFKRRWEWKYIKIAKPEEKDWQIADGTNWWAFLRQINAIIGNMTNSADKQLGYFFAKAEDDKTIPLDKFVSKVCFYLWNDIFKTYAMDGEEGDLFKFTKKATDGSEKETTGHLSFPEFYDDKGEIIENVVKQFIANVMNWNKEKGNQA